MLPLLKLTADWALPTYLLVISLTYCVCIFLVYWRANKLRISVLTALDICLAIMIGGLLGSRLLHIVYEEPRYYLENPLSVFKLWRGGFVFYGGLFGAWLTSWLYLRRKSEEFGRWADFFAPVLSLGYALGRIGCFLNGCCYGKFCAYSWAVDFHQTGLPLGPRHPTQLYATGWEFLVFALLIYIEKRWHASKWDKPGLFFTLWLGLHSLGRLIMEYFREDDRGPFLLGQSPATWVSAGLIIFTTVRMVRHYHTKI